jgi:hypothetical protein
MELLMSDIDINFVGFFTYNQVCTIASLRLWESN